MSWRKARASGVSRRSLLTRAAGLYLALYEQKAQGQNPKALSSGQIRVLQGSGSKSALAWLMVNADGTVLLRVSRCEMGQGVYTALAMLVAEELEVGLQRITVEHAPVTPSFQYSSLSTSATWRSQSVRGLYDELLLLGATAREMLVAAGAKHFGVLPQDCFAENGEVTHPASQRRIAYAALAEAASLLPVPVGFRRKTPAQYRVLGQSQLRLEARPKLMGQITYAADVRLPGMLYASPLFAPVPAAELLAFDVLVREAGKLFPEVKLLKVEGGVLSVAPTWWHADRVWESLSPKWSIKKSDEETSTKKILAKLRGAINLGGVTSSRIGNPGAKFETASGKIISEYFVPFLAPMPMETSAGVAHFNGGFLEVWVASQDPTALRARVARQAGLSIDKVTVHPLYAGGSFGSRMQDEALLQAITAAKALGRPVSVMWSREQELRRGPFGSAAFIRCESGIAANGMPLSLAVKVALPSADSGKAGAKAASKVVSSDLKLPPYGFSDQSVSCHVTDVNVPLGYFRGLSNNALCFAVECFVDELAQRSARDPLGLRRELLSGQTRYLSLLDDLAEMARWRDDPAQGVFRGMAIHAAYQSLISVVVEIALSKGALQVLRVFAAVDCGFAINPQHVEAQIRGGILFGLSAAMFGQISHDGGRVQEQGYSDYRILSPAESPEVNVRIKRSLDPVGGIGELAVPVVQPALVNAVMAATGKRVRHLPLMNANLGPF